MLGDPSPQGGEGLAGVAVSPSETPPRVTMIQMCGAAAAGKSRPLVGRGWGGAYALELVAFVESVFRISIEVGRVKSGWAERLVSTKPQAAKVA
ncbi:hypothetical protein ABIA14_003399 [Sinorhizobium fredii]